MLKLWRAEFQKEHAGVRNAARNNQFSKSVNLFKTFWGGQKCLKILSKLWCEGSMYLYVIAFLMKSLVPVTEGFARIPHGKSWMAKLKKKRFSALFFILTYYYKRIAKNFKTSYVHIQCTQKALWMAKVPILHWGVVGGTSMVCWTHNAYFVPYAMVFISTVPKI